jgi:hypothetical protein
MLEIVREDYLFAVERLSRSRYAPESQARERDDSHLSRADGCRFPISRFDVSMMAEAAIAPTRTIHPW